MPIHFPHDVFGDIQALLPLIVSHALSVLGAAAILLIGIWLANRADAMVSRMLGRAPHFDVMLRSFFGSLARYAVLTITVLAVLSQFGIQTTSVIAVLGAAGLAVGLALQGTLSHLAAGVMLLIFRPFRMGDKVQVGGSTGTVKSLSLFWTELVTDDSIQIIVPNGGIWGTPLKNFTTYPLAVKTGEVRFRVPETIDLDAAVAKIQAILAEQPHIAKDPAPAIQLERTAAENALEIVVTYSAKEADLPAAKTELIRTVHGAIGTAKTV